MSVSVEIKEEFERECAHTAEVIMLTLVSGDEWNSFMLSDVPANLLDDEFIPTVARYLGGKVANDTFIKFEDKTIIMSLIPSAEFHGYYPDVEVSFDIE
jgi:hypothetical protein